MLLKNIRADLQKLANPNKALTLQRFFKTGEGEYGYGDKFLGITVPELRSLAKGYSNEVPFDDLSGLLSSLWHEERMVALLMLIEQYKKAAVSKQTAIYDFYFANVAGINNWDLVDLSAPHIVGAYLLDKKKDFLQELVISKDLWQRRIAVVATLHFIRNDFFAETVLLAEKLLCDKEDLMHKAVGWMLREIGKRDSAVLNNFLSRHYRIMPRTMLRYAIERFPQEMRLAYLHGEISAK